MAGRTPTKEQPNASIEEGWRKQIARVIAHVDLDAFYSQVEVKNDPVRLKGKPVGVVQYNPFGDLATHTPNDDRLFNDSNGSLIAVSYEAREFGVKRNMRGDEARKSCPELQLVQVPTAHGKADLTHYRFAGKQVTDILAHLAVCEKASIDECYLDITVEARRRLEASCGSPVPPVHPEQVHITGQVSGGATEWYDRPAAEWEEGERLLACGAAAVADLRAAVKAELGFSCSAGIAHCKILAKLASGLHKPSQQTVVSKGSVPGLLKNLPIEKLRQLGGKFGEEVKQQLCIETVGELAEIPKARLDALFGDSQGQWLYELAFGIDTDEVKQRTLPKSISCGKTFQGAHVLCDLPHVFRWLKELGTELEERITVDRSENAREPKLLTVHVVQTWPGAQVSRSGPLRRPTAEIIAEDALALVKKWSSTVSDWKITGMSVGVSNFVAAPTGRFFKPAALKKRKVDEETLAGNEVTDAAIDLASASSLKRSKQSADEAAAAEAAEMQTVSSQDRSQSRVAANCVDENLAASGVDPEVWAALPPEIQEELRLTSLGARETQAAHRAAVGLKPGRKKEAKGTITSFFTKKSK